MCRQGVTGWPPRARARLTCRAICSALRALIVPSDWAEHAASPSRESTARRRGSPAPIPAIASSAVETAVRSRRTSWSMSSRYSAASFTGASAIGRRAFLRENASARACRTRSWRRGSAAHARRGWSTASVKPPLLGLTGPCDDDRGRAEAAAAEPRVGRTASIRGRGDDGRPRPQGPPVGAASARPHHGREREMARRPSQRGDHSGRVDAGAGGRLPAQAEQGRMRRHPGAEHQPGRAGRGASVARARSASLDSRAVGLRIASCSMTRSRSPGWPARPSWFGAVRCRRESSSSWCSGGSSASNQS